jgi:hypothetical protein
MDMETLEAQNILAKEDDDSSNTFSFLFRDELPPQDQAHEVLALALVEIQAQVEVSGCNEDHLHMEVHILARV